MLQESDPPALAEAEGTVLFWVTILADAEVQPFAGLVTVSV